MVFTTIHFLLYNISTFRSYFAQTSWNNCVVQFSKIILQRKYILKCPVFFLYLDRLVIVCVIYGVFGGSKDASLCWGELKDHLVGYFALLSSCIVVEALIAYVAMRGTILDPGPRASMQYLLYVRLGEKNALLYQRMIAVFVQMFADICGIYSIDCIAYKS